MVIVSDMKITAEFIGGPLDGEVQELPDLRDRWLVPVPAPAATFDADDFGLTTSKVMVYEVVLDPEMGQPSMNDEGRYRYRYGGIR